jgi:hypothetical protein
MSTARDPATLGEDDRLAASYGRKSDKRSEGLLEQHLCNEQRAKTDGYVIPPGLSIDTRLMTRSARPSVAAGSIACYGPSGREMRRSRVYIKDRTRLGRWSDPRY